MLSVTQTDPKTQPTPPIGRLDEAINLAQSGHKLEARDLLRQIVAWQPVNQAAWLWLSALATERGEAEAALAQARQINPTHPSLIRAEQWLARHFTNQPVTQESIAVAPSPPPGQPGQESGVKSGLLKKATPSLNNLLQMVNSLTFGVMMAVVLVGLLVLFVGLALQVNMTVQASQSASMAPLPPTPDLTQLEAARSARDWATVVKILEAQQRLNPDLPGLNEQLTQAYWQKGLALRHKGFVEEALLDFTHVLTLTPRHLLAEREVRLAQNYLAGAQHYQAGQWPAAITALKSVYTDAADYPHIKDLLFSAYYNHGLALEAAGQLPEAKDAFNAAVALRPDLPDPHRQLTDIEYALAPQTPLPTPISPISNKLIIVGIAEQRMHVYADNKLVFDFVVSTGEPGRDTAIGSFQILDKIDVAYASTWNLDMPYWMGIYWSGPLENGIHALPIVKHTGYKLWDGYLGQRVSYGCVILSDADAVTLYNWADIGTPVKIVPSLADWSP